MIKGYARVSSDGQDFAIQHELLKEAGATQVFSWFSDGESQAEAGRGVVGVAKRPASAH